MASGCTCKGAQLGKGQSILKGKHKKLPLKQTVLDYMKERIMHNKKLQSPAIIFEKHLTHTYESLDNISECIAQVLSIELIHIISSNKNNDLIVGLGLYPSDKMIAVILAILKLGAAYMPLDVKWGPEKLVRQISFTRPIAIIVEDDLEIVSRYKSVSKATQILSISYVYTLAAKFQDVPLSTLANGDREADEKRRHKSNLKPLTLDKNKNTFSMVSKTMSMIKRENCFLWDRTAAVVFTKGTGNHPKAVRLSHKSILNSIIWFTSTFAYDLHNDVYALSSPLNCVHSVGELFGPLTQGIPLVILRRNQLMDIPELVNRIYRHKISKITLQPVHIHLLLKYLLNQENMDDNKTLATKSRSMPNYSTTRVDKNKTGMETSLKSPTKTKSVSSSTKMKTMKERTKMLYKVSSLKYIVSTNEPLPTHVAMKFFSIFDHTSSSSATALNVSSPTQLYQIPIINKHLGNSTSNALFSFSSESGFNLEENEGFSLMQMTQTAASSNSSTVHPVTREINSITSSSSVDKVTQPDLKGTIPHPIQRGTLATLILSKQSSININLPSNLAMEATKYSQKLTGSSSKKLNPKTVGEFFTSTCWLVNTYGTAETSGAACYEIFYGWEDYLSKTKGSGILVTCGRPIANTTIYILNDKFKVQKLGEVGEICVAGSVVSDGYCGLHQSPSFVDNYRAHHKGKYMVQLLQFGNGIWSNRRKQ